MITSDPLRPPDWTRVYQVEVKKKVPHHPVPRFPKPINLRFSWAPKIDQIDLHKTTLLQCSQQDQMQHIANYQYWEYGNMPPRDTSGTPQRPIHRLPSRAHSNNTNTQYSPNWNAPVGHLCTITEHPNETLPPPTPSTPPYPPNLPTGPVNLNSPHQTTPPL